MAMGRSTEVRARCVIAFIATMFFGGCAVIDSLRTLPDASVDGGRPDSATPDDQGVLDGAGDAGVDAGVGLDVAVEDRGTIDDSGPDSGDGDDAGEDAESLDLGFDAAGRDAEPSDLGVGDEGVADAGEPAVEDATIPDAALPDGEVGDLGLGDGEPVDSGFEPDSGMHADAFTDAATPQDAGQGDAGVSLDGGSDAAEELDATLDAGFAPDADLDGGVADGGLDSGILALAGAYVAVLPGTFTMGSPSSEVGRSAGEVQHVVTISRGFWMKQTEVTQGEWRALLGTSPAQFATCGDACPVELVTWDDAIAYVNALSVAAGLPPCYSGSPGNWTYAGLLACPGFRLPTEAEWEYAARAGTSGPFGEAATTLDMVGWYSGNAGGTPHAVATKQPNSWGLFDMLGNVAEWVNDWSAAYPAGAATDPIGPASGAARIVRGGGWYYSESVCRAAWRLGIAPATRDSSLGFRPVRSMP